MMVDYWIEKFIKKQFDFCIERQKKKFDHLFLVDGDEGYGKSTAVVGWANYIAEKIGKDFTVDNVFFEAENMLEFAANTKEEVIVWDEAATAGMSVQWQSKLQQKLIKMLMMARKKGHFWFFVIPKFFRLNEYIVVDRAKGLFHIYSPDDLKRGYFVYYGKKKMDKIYYKVKKTKIRNYKNYDRRGTYVLKGFVIDEEKYNAKKDQAIKNLTRSKMSKTKLENHWLKWMISKYPQTNKKKIAKYFNVSLKTVYNWYNYTDKYPKIEGFEL